MKTIQPPRFTGRGCPKRVLALFFLAAIFFLLAITTTVSISSPERPGVIVRPGDNIEALVAAHPPGTTFTITPGIYRMQSISPKDGDSYLGEPGADLSGAQLLTSFTQQNQAWTAGVGVQSQGSYRGECDDSHPACMFPEDLFVDDVPLQRVANLSNLAPGKWYLDYGTGTVYVADNPNGHRVEISLAVHAFNGSAKNVTVRGLTVEKYADVAGDGAIGGQAANGRRTSGWVVQDNVIKFNHGMGIRVGDGMQVLSNKIIYNGQMGLGGSGNNILVAGNEIAHNNYDGYKYGWEAGGCKFTFTRGLVVRDNFSHDNAGPGLWTDIENNDVLYENNRTTANREAGILHEISHHAIIRGNTIDRDGFDGPGSESPWHGGGIVVTGSDNVEVYGNTVTDCMNGIIGLQPNRNNTNGEIYALRNLDVHNNVITQNAGVAAGILASGAVGDAVFSSWGNRFADNTFHLSSKNRNYFTWLNSPESLAAWLRHSQTR